MSHEQRLWELAEGIKPSQPENEGVVTPEILERMRNMMKGEAINMVQKSEIQVAPRRLGNGVFADVFSGTYRNQTVAVKRLLADTIDEEIIQDFCSEVTILSKVRHPNIVEYVGTCLEDLSIITELVEGANLFQILRKAGKPLDWRNCRHVALGVAQGVAYLHNCVPPVVHRDLKSLNVLIGHSAQIKLCDFGLALFKRLKAISTQRAAGSPAWMAPEILQGKEFDEMADVYSYSVVLWEMLSGKIPWDDKDNMQIVALVGYRARRLPLPAVPPAGYPPRFIQLIQDCWSHEPRNRPTFSQMVSILQSL